MFNSFHIMTYQWPLFWMSYFMSLMVQDTQTNAKEARISMTFELYEFILIFYLTLNMIKITDRHFSVKNQLTFRYIWIHVFFFHKQFNLEWWHWYFFSSVIRNKISTVHIYLYILCIFISGIRVLGIFRVGASKKRVKQVKISTIFYVSSIYIYLPGVNIS